jgi:hypothetical protein
MSVFPDAYEESYPPSLWAAPPPPPEPPTGATAGTPGTWTPAGSAVPADLAAANALGLTLGAAWPAGSYVVLGDASQAHWDGLAFAAGAAPVVEATATEAKRKPGRPPGSARKP